MHADNSHHLVAAAKRRHDETRARAIQALGADAGTGDRLGFLFRPLMSAPV